jgi:Rieske 2Fe-2S family protein
MTVTHPSPDASAPWPDPTRVADDPSGSLRASLPGFLYTDREVFHLERDRVFRRSWQCVGRADAAPEPGDFLHAECAGESVLVLRGRDRTLRAFHNVCRHRGARLCEGPTGSVGRAVRCGYHGWGYDLDGRLIAAPNMADMPDLDKDRLGLHPVRLEEWLGYAWVTLDRDAAPLSAQVEPQVLERLGTTATLARYRIEDLRLARTVTYDVASNWKALIENFMECYHCATIHPELTAALPTFATGYGTIAGGVGAGAALAPGLDGFSLSGRADRPMLPGLLPSDDRLFYGIVLRPNAFLILVPDHVAVFRLEPTAPDRTVVVVDWLFDPDAMSAPGFDPDDAVELLDLTNRQDFDACRRAQLGMASTVYRGVLVPAEHVVLPFHDEVRRVLADVLGQGPAA